MRAGTNSSRYEAVQSDVNCGGCSVSVCTFMLLNDANGRKSCIIHDNSRFISLLLAEQSAERAPTMRTSKTATLLLTAAGENFPHGRGNPIFFRNPASVREQTSDHFGSICHRPAIVVLPLGRTPLIPRHLEIGQDAAHIVDLTSDLQMPSP